MDTEQTEQLPPLSRDGLDETFASMILQSSSYSQQYCFYAHLAAMCSVSLERMQAPAAVSFHLDHYRLHVNPELFDKFPIQERLFVIQHEMHHILNGHVHRLEDRDHRAFNYATDCAINQLGNPKHMPNGLIIPATLPSKHKVPDKLSAEQYYELLDRDQLPPEDPNFGHDKWGDSQGDEELQADITKGMIEKAIAQTQKSRGDVPGDISRYLDLHSRKAELDWRKLLKQYLSNKKTNTKKTILRRDRRSPHLEHIKGRVKERTFTAAMISDVSGSVSDTELYALWNETRHICEVNNAAIQVVQVDARAYDPTPLTKGTKIFPRKATGGTYLSPALEKLKEHHIDYSILIVTTDGELSEDDVAKFAATGKPIIWLISANGTVMESMQTSRMKAFKITAT